MSSYTVAYKKKKKPKQKKKRKKEVTSLRSIHYIQLQWLILQHLFYAFQLHIKNAFPVAFKNKTTQEDFYSPFCNRNKHERDKILAHPFRCLEKAEMVGQAVSHSGVTGRAIQVSLAKGERMPPDAVINVTWKDEQTALPKNRSIAHPWLALSLSQQLSPCPPAAPPSTSSLRDHPCRLSPAHHFTVLEYSVVSPGWSLIQAQQKVQKSLWDWCALAQIFGSERNFSEAKSQGAQSPQFCGWSPRAQENVRSVDY